MPMHNGWGMGWGLGGMMIQWIFLLALIVLVVWIVVRIALRPPQDSPSASVESPEQILKARYARGEIDKQKFDEMMKDLRT